MRRPLLAVLLALLLAAGALGVAADEGKDESGHGGDDGDRDDGDREGDGGRDGDDDRDEDRDGDDDREDDRKDKRDGKDERTWKDHGERKERRKVPAPEERPSEPVPQPVPVALTGDAALRQSVRNEPGRLTYVFVVGGLGPGMARDVSLAADLPEVATRWSLAGAGSEACSVGADLRLSCSWGDLGLGDVEVFQLTAHIEKAPAWEVRTVAELEAGNDRDRRNDAASSVIGILLT